MPNLIVRRRFVFALHVFAHLAALLPLLWLFIAIPAGTLGADPVKELIHYLGLGALRLLLLTLVISPLANFSNWLPGFNKLRRPLGLWCYAWASLHFFAWIYLELGFDWRLIGDEIVKRQYILLGFIAWLVLSVLAISSLPALLRKMGARWKQVHGFIYLVALLACWHFWWSLKSGWIEPCIYLLVALALLFLRKRKLLQWLKSFR